MNSFILRFKSLISSPLLDGLLVATLCMVISADVLAVKKDAPEEMHVSVDDRLIQVAFGNYRHIPLYIFN